MSLLFLLTFHLGFATPNVGVFSADTLDSPVDVVYDERERALYISNHGGFLTKIGIDGKGEEKWFDGLKGPGPLTLHKKRIFVVEKDRVTSIHLGTKKSKKIPVEGAGSLSGIAAGEDGRVFISDVRRNTLYLLRANKLSRWSTGAHLHQPNGLFLQGDQLYIACQGGPTVQGEIRIIPLIDGAVTSQWSEPVGRLYGIVSDGEFGFYVTDRERGLVLHLSDDGSEKVVARDLDGPSGLCLIPEKKQLFVVESGKNRLVILPF